MTERIEIGPFRIVGTLGAGGMGQVYEAIHQGSGQRCAVKTVHSEGMMDIHALRALRREVHVLAELDHPNIVKVIDFDLESQNPWFAMEYIAGRTFSDWNRSTSGEVSTADTILEIASRTSQADWDALQDAIQEAQQGMPALDGQSRKRPMPVESDWAPSPTLRTQLAWLGQISRALQFLHGLNIVHGDVKPDNVLIRNDGVAVLVDFGLVSRRGRRVTRNALERSLTRAQTLEYAAPERLIASDYDARADLYALGCMLYEIFQGSPPFTGPPAAVAIAHVAKTPPPIQDVSELPPPAMKSIIADLLIKNPYQRTPYALQLCGLLEAYSIATEPSGQSLPKSRPYLYSPEFVGFDTELAEANRAVQMIGRDAPSLIQVTGPEGSGKSRFLLEVTATAVQSTPHVHVMSAVDQNEHRTPFASLMHVLDHLVDLCVADDWRPVGASLWLARLEPRLQQFLSTDDRRTLEGLLDVVPAAAEMAMVHAIVGVLRDLAASKPIAVVVESLDQLEHGSRAVIDEMLRRSESEPWLVIATGTHAVDIEAHRSMRIVLPKLDDAAISTMTSQILGGERLDDEAVSLLSSTSGRRPAVLIDLMHSMLDLEMIAQDKRGQWNGRDGQSLSSAVQALVEVEASRPERRIAQLSDSARQVAEFCSVFGRKPKLRDLMTLEVLDSGQVLMALSDLIGSKILVESDFGTFNNDYVLEFSSQSIRSTLYGAMRPERRAAMHRAAAEVMSTRDDLPACAHHLELAGLGRRAYQVWLDAAARAKQQYAQSLHARCLEGALRVADWITAEERERLLLERYKSLCEVSATPVVEAESKPLLASIQRPEIRCQILAQYFRRMILESKSDVVEPYIAELKELAESDVPAVAVTAHATLLNWHGHHDRRDEAVAAGRRAESLASATNDLDLKFEGTSALVNALFRTENVDECLHFCRRALVLAEASGEHRKIHAATGRLAAVRARQGHFADLDRVLRPVADFQRRAHLLSDLMNTVHNIGYGNYYVGRFAAVLRGLDEIDEVRKRLGIEDDEAADFAMRAAVMGALGHMDGARQEGMRAIGVARTPWVRIHAELQFGEMLQLAGEFQASLEFLDSVVNQDWSDEHRQVLNGLSARGAINVGDLERAARDLALAMNGQQTPVETAIYGAEEGRLQLRRGQFGAARLSLETALNWFDDHDVLYDATLIRIQLVRCFKALGEAVPEGFLDPAAEYVESEPFLPSAYVRRELRSVMN